MPAESQQRLNHLMVREVVIDLVPETPERLVRSRSLRGSSLSTKPRPPLYHVISWER